MQRSNIPGHNSPDRVSVPCWCSKHSTNRSEETEGRCNLKGTCISSGITVYRLRMYVWLDVHGLTWTHGVECYSPIHTHQLAFLLCTDFLLLATWTTANLPFSCFKQRMPSFITTSWPPRITHNYVMDDSNKRVMYIINMYVYSMCCVYVL